MSIFQLHSHVEFKGENALQSSLNMWLLIEKKRELDACRSTDHLSASRWCGSDIQHAALQNAAVEKMTRIMVCPADSVHTKSGTAVKSKTVPSSFWYGSRPVVQLWPSLTSQLTLQPGSNFDWHCASHGATTACDTMPRSIHLVIAGRHDILRNMKTNAGSNVELPPYPSLWEFDTHLLQRSHFYFPETTNDQEIDPQQNCCIQWSCCGHECNTGRLVQSTVETSCCLSWELAGGARRAAGVN